ncbi:hypothetical protein ZIOFF_000829 [Zingiber officinale]|uniref:Uncharacterized protein n=1 Tax=Zingiber officinale TaxID=94328 RepID=A0A8J5M6W7_ZINOF|nr:hypothetical protein ZIOFF_000829 [Zingiber officinale]
MATLFFLSRHYNATICHLFLFSIRTLFIADVNPPPPTARGLYQLLWADAGALASPFSPTSCALASMADANTRFADADPQSTIEYEYAIIKVRLGSEGGNSIGLSGSGESKDKVGRFIYSATLPFNVMNDPYWLPMVEGIAEYGRRFKPPSMHELRTWTLKAEFTTISNNSGKVVKRIVINDPNFWPHVVFCIKSVVPLVSMLREVDSEERLAMGYIYELMDRQKR